jgi:hypothetical protein
VLRIEMYFDSFSKDVDCGSVKEAQRGDLPAGDSRKVRVQGSFPSQNIRNYIVLTNV